MDGGRIQTIPIVPLSWGSDRGVALASARGPQAFCQAELPTVFPLWRKEGKTCFGFWAGVKVIILN